MGKIYYFHTSFFTGWRPQLTIGDRAKGKDTLYSLTEATYGRFVCLANSGQYRIRIVEEEGVAWEMER